ncbi:hypothetical protein [Phaeobacter italicus]|uniref:hypothetical protein n=1 Tax=Phaeobacter italicus TaxID=481446 RepID=UPI00018701AB|nr:hypothetical protein [Phaeobacter italicus]EEB69954.1 conserved hypothetical protein [Ruegeria sp. R11]CRL15541.1 hypothetical protein NIT7645_02592 [Phaeobacter italicus]SFG48974.1 hypothetical protein SAMN04488019_102152 [Phaeobacter italicus]
MIGRRGFLAFLALLPLGSVQATPFAVPELAPPSGAMTVYHLGHSLVGADIPHMLAQLAPKEHAYNTQLGSGTPLQQHWEPDQDILHFDQVNHPPIWRDAREAVGSGDYDAVILTEMVELRDAIRYFKGARYFRRWADLARAGSADTRLYLYETWHPLDTPDGWLARIDTDLEQLWLGGLAGSDTRRNPNRPAYLIPAGQVMAAVVRAIEAGEIPGLSRREDVFAITPDGAQDQIHINDLGAYIVALTHLSVLYHVNPAGQPHQLTRADGSPAQAFSAEAARKVQEIVWTVVTSHPRTGVRR